jgi:hypothetical protein
MQLGEVVGHEPQALHRNRGFAVSLSAAYEKPRR